MSATQSWFEPSTVLSRARFEKIGLSWSRTTTAERPHRARFRRAARSDGRPRDDRARLVTRLKFARRRQSAVVEDINMKASRSLEGLFQKLVAGDGMDP